MHAANAARLIQPISSSQQGSPSALSSGGPSTPPASTSQPLLYQAARDGDTTIVKRLLAAGGIDVNAIDPDTHLSALMLAARHGHDDVVLVLTKGAHGADVNQQNSRRDSALSLAASSGKNDVVELLLDRKADLEQVNHSGRTPLAEAAAGGHVSTATLLLARSARVDGSLQGGKPPLTIAARRGDSALVALLLEQKASMDVADRHGWSAFHHAASMGHAALAERLRGSGTTTANQSSVVHALEQDVNSAAEAGDDEHVAQGITLTTAATAATAATTTTTTTPATTTLTTVVTTQPAYVVRPTPGTPAGAASDKLTALRKAVEKNDVAALNQIITAHPDDRAMLNQTIAFERQRGLLPAGSYTLLMLAAAHGHQPMVEALLALGADVNASGSGGMSALLLAVRHRQIDTVEALLKAGAAVDAQAEDGNTAVMLALARRDASMVQVLLNGVGEPREIMPAYVEGPGSRPPQTTVKYYLHKTNGGVVMQAVVDPGDISSCLREAAANGYVNTVRLLLKAGADVNGFDDVMGERKGIPHHKSVHDWGSYLHQQYAHYYDSQGVLNPFANRNWAESLALVRAARNGHTATVQALLDAGASADRGYDCQQVMLDAVKNRRIGIMRMLLEARQRAPFPSDFITREMNKNYLDCTAKDMHEAFTWAIQWSDDDLTVFQALLQMPYGKATVLNDPDLLLAALRSRRLANVKALLDADANPNKPYLDQYPIVLAVQMDDPALARKSLDMLLKAGALPELARQHGKDKATLLEHAVPFGNVELIEYLLSLGAEACGDKNDISAALLKACNGLYDLNKIALLLNAGADPNWKSADGKTPLYQAACFSRNDAVELLIRHKAQVDLPAKGGSLEGTPLMAAACNSKIKTVRLLLEAGADRTLKDGEGKTALYRAKERNDKAMVELLCNWKPNASS